jgi:hypothetical protein
LIEIPAVQPLSATVSNHWSTTKKRKITGNRRTWPGSGELLQNNGIEPRTQQKARLELYREGTLTLLIAGRRRRGEGRGQPALDLEENEESRWGAERRGKKEEPVHVTAWVLASYIRTPHMIDMRRLELYNERTYGLQLTCKVERLPYQNTLFPI